MYLLTILTVIFFNDAIRTVHAENYRAGVVVYKPVTTEDGQTDDDVVLANADNYVELLKKYNNDIVDILVFPEFGITAVSAEKLHKTQLHLVVTEIKPPGVMVCKNGTKGFAAQLGCAAKDNNVYAIVNLIEKDGDKNFITTVGFAPDGTVCLRCRKYHLANGTYLDKAADQKSCSFTANIKNKLLPFTVLFEDDLIHGIPADLDNKNVIVTSLIKNILPLNIGFNLYQGFAVSHGVNLLVSGYYERLTKNYGGSGIYYSNGTSVVAFKPDGDDRSKVLIKNIPVSTTSGSKIQVRTEVVGEIPKLDLKYVNISGLDTKKKAVEKCWDSPRRCCNFDAQLSEETISTYNWIALSNKTTIVKEEVDVFLCALALPSNGTVTKFQKLKIASTFDVGTRAVETIPFALGPGLIPLNYDFDKEKNAITLSGEKEILVFGLLFTLGPAETGSNVGTTIGLVVGIIAILIVCGWLGFIGFKKWRNKQNEKRRGKDTY